ncbi:MAG: 4Fe-4S dicluster domain-containing protein, partial [Paramuribaculum sp.]|nr:4Fe-4S dicluster domain-containing protein [Paramuribaculum sp.]
CKYCMPCPYGIDIPSILLHYNKCVNQGNVAESSQSDNYAEARRAFLVGYDRSVPRLRQASHCIGCGQCTPHCPQSIDIPKELHRIDSYVESLKQESI